MSKGIYRDIHMNLLGTMRSKQTLYIMQRLLSKFSVVVVPSDTTTGSVDPSFRVALHSEKRPARPMLFYSPNYWHQF